MLGSVSLRMAEVMRRMSCEYQNCVATRPGIPGHLREALMSLDGVDPALG